MKQVQTLKGFRDFLPEQKRKKDYVIAKITEVFQNFAFEPIETPTLESLELLLGKYGTEADKLIYKFEDNGGRKVGLRYDQTVPSARIISQYQSLLPRYFRRYQVQDVFRADKPQKGRFRQFTQCDVDIYNVVSDLADAEILATTYFSLKNVGFPSIKILVNDRAILFDTLNQYATSQVDVYSIIQSIDKLDKISPEQVATELVSKGLDMANATNILADISKAKPNDNLNNIMAKAKTMGIPDEAIVFVPTITRGLDYYTGMIFEAKIDGYTVGSVCGGGRYDNLINDLIGMQMPAVGVGLGLDRIIEAADEMGLLQDIADNFKILISSIDKSCTTNNISLASELRMAGISTDMFPIEDAKLSKQFAYADKNKYKIIVLQGDNEVKADIVKIKFLESGKEKEIPRGQIVAYLTGLVK
jgi:histidyl-tRNA synthetase